MADVLFQSVLLGAASAVLSMIVLVPIALLFDRIVVWVDDRLGKRHFLLAREIAAGLRRAPGEWVATSLSLHHRGRDVELRVFASGEVYEVKTSAGSWAPNRFERRILARALQQRIREDLGEKILGTRTGSVSSG